jgi:hypothetical protein
MSSLADAAVPPPHGPQTTDTVVQRTSGFNYAGFFGAAPLFAAGIFGFARNPGIHDRGIFIAGSIAVLLLLVAYALVMSPRMKQETLTVDGARLIYKGAWRTRVIDVRGGRAVDLPYKVMGGATYRRWLFLNEKGSVSLRLKVGPWARNDLTSLASVLGLPVEAVQVPIRPRKARRTYPGAWSWPGAHPTAAFLLLFLAITTICVVVNVSVSGPSS